MSDLGNLVTKNFVPLFVPYQVLRVDFCTVCLVYFIPTIFFNGFSETITSLCTLVHIETNVDKMYRVGHLDI